MIKCEKNALITGAGSEIAKSIIENFKNTFNFVKHKKNYVDSFLFGDLSNEEIVKSVFGNIKNLDLLVCCAGGDKGILKRPHPDDCASIGLSDAHEIFNRNFFSTFLTCKHVIEKMNLNSNIIIIGSAVVSKPRKDGELGMYACAKAAVHEYTKHLAKKMENKIKVNCLAVDGRDCFQQKIKKTIDSINIILKSNITGEIFRLDK